MARRELAHRPFGDRLVDLATARGILAGHIPAPRVPEDPLPAYERPDPPPAEETEEEAAARRRARKRRMESARRTRRRAERAQGRRELREAGYLPEHGPAEITRGNDTLWCVPARKRAFRSEVDALAALILTALDCAADGDRGPRSIYPCRYVDGGHLHMTHYDVAVPRSAVDRPPGVEPPDLIPQRWVAERAAIEAAAASSPLGAS